MWWNSKPAQHNYSKSIEIKRKVSSKYDCENYDNFRIKRGLISTKIKRHRKINALKLEAKNTHSASHKTICKFWCDIHFWLMLLYVLVQFEPISMQNQASKVYLNHNKSVKVPILTVVKKNRRFSNLSKCEW